MEKTGGKAHPFLKVRSQKEKHDKRILQKGIGAGTVAIKLTIKSQARAVEVSEQQRHPGRAGGSASPSSAPSFNEKQKRNSSL